MKLTLSLLAITLGGLVTGMAGGFGGPGPFRNDSPLPTGTDGLYNASMRGDNLAGIFRFSIVNGSQGGDVIPPTVSPGPGAAYSTRGNSWVAWYEGIVYRGLTDAAIIDGKVAGVLDVMAAPAVRQGQPQSPVTGVITTPVPGGNVVTPVQFPPGINTSLTGGQFSGSIDLNSPTGAMKGSGTFTVIENLGTVDENLEPRGPNEQFVADEVAFKWRGARVFSGTVGSATPAP